MVSRNSNKSGRNGAVLIWSMAAMVLFTGVCTLSVDWGRVQLAKTELQGAADAAVRAGAAALAQSPANAVTAAQNCAAMNRADGRSIGLTYNTDLQLGYWDTNAKTFTVLTGGDTYRANAVRAVARRDATRGDGVNLSFGALFGVRARTVSAEAIAMFVSAVNVDAAVPATANPFLAGMPAGSVASRNNPHNSPDYAGTTSDPKQSPLTVNLPLKEGAALTFDSITGLARHDPTLADYNPDGQASDIGHNTAGNENGIADANIPINALVGVFLDDNAPDLTRAPASLDFTSAASRDFTQLQPKLKQIFFIGDGLNSAGDTQKFIVPAGATRLYVATWDFYEWNNNAGSRTVKVNRPEQIITVK